eukprot:1768296-Pleurochrysis_carterae.AAC.1
MSRPVATAALCAALFVSAAPVPSRVDAALWPPLCSTTRLSAEDLRSWVCEQCPLVFMIPQLDEAEIESRMSLILGDLKDAVRIHEKAMDDYRHRFIFDAKYRCARARSSVSTCARSSVSTCA